MPIKTQDYIHAFFSRNAGLEFITIKQGQTVDSIMREKLDTWQLFDKKMRHHNRIVRGVSNRMRACINRLQHIIGVHRQYSFTKLYYGDNWVSLTNDFTRYLLSMRHRILHDFRHTYCSDEVFIQSVAMESPFKDRLNPAGNMRKIDWERGGPYTWRSDDIDELMQSEQLFARKFETKIDRDIAYKLKTLLSK